MKSDETLAAVTKQLLQQRPQIGVERMARILRTTPKRLHRLGLAPTTESK